MLLSSLTATICNGRNHIDLTYFEAYSYCTLLAVSYVASLYCLVPQKVRQLQNRDDPIQIRWRGFATSIVCLIAFASYQFIFCEPLIAGSGIRFPFNWRAILGSTITATSCAILHTSMLYFGVYIRLVLLVYETLRKQDGTVLPSKLLFSLYAWYINPVYESIVHNLNLKRWIVLRNLVIAPITEEIVFRSCMVPVLHSTGMSASNVCFIAPLFFGFAHVHHAVVKLRQGNAFGSVVLLTIFQFVYTSLFGAYASYTYQRSASLAAVVLSHSMCNALGIPDVSFFETKSSLYPYRIILLISLILGFVSFVLCLPFLYISPHIIAD